MLKQTLNSAGFSLSKVFVAILMLVVLAFASHFITHDVFGPSNSNKTSSKSNSSGSSSQISSPYATLSPATVSSKTAECTQQLTYGTNGAPGPLTCSNGDLNVTAWNSLSAIEPKVMTLGYNPSFNQVESAICADATAADADSNANSSTAVEETVYQISVIYYGWNFSSDPTVVLTNGTC